MEGDDDINDKEFTTTYSNLVPSWSVWHLNPHPTWFLPKVIMTKRKRETKIMNIKKAIKKRICERDEEIIALDMQMKNTNIDERSYAYMTGRGIEIENELLNLYEMERLTNGE